ncbi:MAG: hypothetical protein R2848_00405 [Thermomicrobiales bacterium]
MSATSVAPFDAAPGVWLRCAFHVHTTASDGWLAPHIQRQYHHWGSYDVLALTDHDMHTPEPDGADDLLLIGGTELSLIAPKSGGPLHLLGIGVNGPVEADSSSTLADAARAVRVQGGLPFLAHPVWSGLRTDEVDGIEHCAGMEIFNASCEVEQGRGHNDAHADVWLSQGHRLGLIATDDTHYPGYDAFRAWTMVHAADRPRGSAGGAGNRAVLRLVGSAPARPALRWRTAGGALHTGGLDCGAGESAIRQPDLGRTARDHLSRRTPAHRRWAELGGDRRGELLTGARFPVRPGMRYLRVVVTDALGNRAWSNPVWVE